MGALLLVHLPSLAVAGAGARRCAAAGGPRRDRGAGRFSVSAAAPGGPVKEEEEEEEEKGARRRRRKEGIVIRVSDPVRERRLPPPLFSSPDAPSEPPAARRRGGDDGGEEQRRYYVNLGDAIRTLREELPTAFYREPSFHIYSPSRKESRKRRQLFLSNGEDWASLSENLAASDALSRIFDCLLEG
ncbi:uncharacterized protein LOC102702758 isoform X2 [Oryza brachyantha]|uniref:uncharacterized protein LOC102702758 isoform X2 n=1 Tax=Oryza brachyantha TaxID=4533 RepID=UPI001ADA0C1C|nr:uncharacterized protein LOC102702758 isoform X2 [Oryza brachyantha]